MVKIPKKMGEILVESGILTRTQLEIALEAQQKSKKLLGEILVEMNFITREKLDLALTRQFGSVLGEILMRSRLITFEQLQIALKKQTESCRPLGEILVNMNFISEETLLKALSSQYNMPYIKLSGYPINVEAINKVPMELCKRHNVLPIDINENFLVIATSNPENIIAEDDIRVVSGMWVKIVIASSSEIRSYLE